MGNRRFGIIALIGMALVGLIAGMVFTAKLDVFNQANGQETGKAEVVQAVRTPTEDPASQPFTFDAFRKIAKRLNPTVVNIYTTQIVRGRDPFHDFFGDDPFFHRFFGDQPEREQRQSSLGSGVIIDPEGYILTNNHVVENADEIKVSLTDNDDGRNGLTAKVVGRDPKTDIALIKITPKDKLAAAPLGSSSELQVGDWVIAIGNPFALGHTVTVGVVSALGRSLGGNYDDFIQTDASINPGNSGGPLLNLRGEVIGINTEIASRTGQSAGIGFAVPIDLAKEILPQLKTAGRVTRGQLGITIQSQWSDALAKEFGVDHGALVSDVTKGSPAEKAGVKQGDVIVEYNGKALTEGNDLPRLVAATKPGTKVDIKVVRDKKEKTMSVEVGTMKDADVAEASESQPEEAGAELGLTVMNLDSDMAQQLDLDTDQGVVISRVKVGSPAEDAGLQKGDVILEINRKQVKNVQDYRANTSKAKPGDSLLFLIYRRGGSIFIPVQIPQK
ncbi:MAG TPA: DegQ family serine endoprotease [Acidobacteriota bacterium]|nr:DegQ family serine endoprotease [Acidobacteriota bacterium]